MLKFTDENGEERCLNELVKIEMQKERGVVLYEATKCDQRLIDYPKPSCFTVKNVIGQMILLQNERGEKQWHDRKDILNCKFYDAIALIKFQMEWIEAQKKLI